MIVTPETIQQIRDTLGQSQQRFGKTLWNAIHHSASGPGFTRSYISMLEQGKAPIGPNLIRAIQVITMGLDGTDEVQARAHQAHNILGVHDLPAGTVVLGHAQQCATPGCPVVFVATHPQQKYHSRMCAKAARRLRRKSPLNK